MPPSYYASSTPKDRFAVWPSSLSEKAERARFLKGVGEVLALFPNGVPKKIPSSVTAVSLAEGSMLKLSADDSICHRVLHTMACIAHK